MGGPPPSCSHSFVINVGKDGGGAVGGIERSRVQVPGREWWWWWWEGVVVIRTGGVGWKESGGGGGVGSMNRITFPGAVDGVVPREHPPPSANTASTRSIFHARKYNRIPPPTPPPVHYSIGIILGCAHAGAPA